MNYLTRWRMHLATQRLADGSDPLTAIADAIGYESVSAFSKAFKHRVGKTPAAYRRDARMPNMPT